MEVKILLLLLGFATAVGVVWDIWRAKRQKPRRKRTATVQIMPTFEEGEAPSPLSTPQPNVEREPKMVGTIAPREPLVCVDQVNANELVTLSVMARPSEVFSGKKLQTVFQDVHLYYGDMQIFHRHENIDGTGKIVYSVVSAIEPGRFDLTKMESFITPGLTLFFILTTPNQSIFAFELLLRTAKQMALRLNGEVKDDKKATLTPSMIEQYRERVRQGVVSVRKESSRFVEF